MVSQADEFEAIVANLDDPEWLQLRRLFLTVATAAFVVSIALMGVVGALAAPVAGGFSATYLLGTAVGLRGLKRRWHRRNGLRPGTGSTIRSETERGDR
jgi:hypothetical protein